MATERQQIHIVAPVEQHKYTILLHGRDSDASEFAKDFLESQASDDRTLPEIFANVKWAFPTSKIRKSERFQGTRVSQWFDMWTTEQPDEREELQIVGLNESISDILEIIRQEIDMVGGADHVILGGISQGCATAIHALFQCEPLAGFIGLCSWLPFETKIKEITSACDNAAEVLHGVRHLLRPTFNSSVAALPGANSTPVRTPVFLSHSVGDPIIIVSNGQNLRLALDGLGMCVE